MATQRSKGKFETCYDVTVRRANVYEWSLKSESNLSSKLFLILTEMSVSDKSVVQEPRMHQEDIVWSLTMERARDEQYAELENKASLLRKQIEEVQKETGQTRGLIENFEELEQSKSVSKDLLEEYNNVERDRKQQRKDDLERVKNFKKQSQKDKEKEIQNLEKTHKIERKRFQAELKIKLQQLREKLEADRLQLIQTEKAKYEQLKKDTSETEIYLKMCQKQQKKDNQDSQVRTDRMRKEHKDTMKELKRQHCVQAEQFENKDNLKDELQERTKTEKNRRVQIEKQERISEESRWKNNRRKEAYLEKVRELELLEQREIYVEAIIGTVEDDLKEAQRRRKDQDNIRTNLKAKNDKLERKISVLTQQLSDLQGFKKRALRAERKTAEDPKPLERLFNRQGTDLRSRAEKVKHDENVMLARVKKSEDCLEKALNSQKNLVRNKERQFAYQKKNRRDMLEDLHDLDARIRKNCWPEKQVLKTAPVVHPDVSPECSLPPVAEQTTSSP